jgi:bacterioferritin-associated ferredoxin
MIVCSCNVLTDNDVRSALSAADTPRTTGQVYGCLGCSAQCGRCARTIKRIMTEALAGAAITADTTEAAVPEDLAGAGCPSGCGCTGCGNR